MLVHIIADYGTGDLAFAEVVQRIKLHLPDAEPVPVPVPSFSTLAGGFCIAQLGLNTAPPGTLIYHNVAPREDDQAARPGNAGERLAYARLPTGVRVMESILATRSPSSKTSRRNFGGHRHRRKAVSSVRETSFRKPLPPSRWGSPLRWATRLTLTHCHSLPPL